MDLSGRIAIITGGARGLGAEIENQFREACAIPVVAHRGNVDVTLPAQIDDFVNDTLKAFGRIDILVNNAAILGPVGGIDSNDWNAWRETIETNLFGPVYFTRACLPAMKKQNFGKIINIAGGGACDPLPRRTAYACSKAALVRFTESVAKELQGTGIEINAVLPGPMDTDMHREILAHGPQRLGYKEHEDQLNARMSDPVNVAKLVTYLASDEGNYISGKTIAARWDRFPFTPAEKTKMSASDQFTLRRIKEVA